MTAQEHHRVLGGAWVSQACIQHLSGHGLQVRPSAEDLAHEVDQLQTEGQRKQLHPKEAECVHIAIASREAECVHIAHTGWCNGSPPVTRRVYMYSFKYM